MNILSFFIIVPLLMLAGLWASRSVNQVRGVMVTGASLLLALSVYLTIDYIGLRQAGAMEEMLFTDSISLVCPLTYMLLHRSGRYLRSHVTTERYHCLHRNICIMETSAPHQRVFPMVHTAEFGSVRILYLNRPVHHVYVL